MKKLVTLASILVLSIGSVQAIDLAKPTEKQLKTALNQVEQDKKNMKNKAQKLRKQAEKTGNSAIAAQADIFEKGWKALERESNKINRKLEGLVGVQKTK